mmetsp:Transcript_923/g.2482  ORF Transcript_923/g.2482 Transcript_923/m.2482 type:complete len:243 (-) Transcript_923:537-1265(-)
MTRAQCRPICMPACTLCISTHTRSLHRPQPPNSSTTGCTGMPTHPMSGNAARLLATSSSVVPSSNVAKQGRPWASTRATLLRMDKPARGSDEGGERGASGGGPGIRAGKPLRLLPVPSVLVPPLTSSPAVKGFECGSGSAPSDDLPAKAWKVSEASEMRLLVGLGCECTLGIAELLASSCLATCLKEQAEEEVRGSRKERPRTCARGEVAVDSGIPPMLPRRGLPGMLGPLGSTGACDRNLA